jgi:hypothetical protein
VFPALSRFGGSATRILRQGPAEQNRLSAREKKLRRVGLTSKMNSRPRRGNERSSSWVAAVASVSAGAHQPGRSQTWRERSGRSRLHRPGRRHQRRPSARRRPRAASRDPSRLPRSFAGPSRARRQDLKMLRDARTQRWARSHSDGGLSAAKAIATSVSLFQETATCRTDEASEDVRDA